MRSFLVIALLAALCLVDSAPAISKSQRLVLQVINQRPCKSKAGPNEIIRFPDSTQAPLKPDPSKGEGCYSIQGPIVVKKDIECNLQVYVEIKFGTKGAPQPCKNQDSNGCGGVGSCVYCEICDQAKNIEKTSKGMVHIESTDGSSLFSKKGIKAGTYNNAKISFCLPTKDEAMKALDGDSFLEEYLAQKNVFSVEMKVVNKPINKWSAKQLQDIGHDELIGCQRIVGTVSSAADE